MTELSVKYFNSGMVGAPQLSNHWGDLVSLLDACLIDGFHLKAIDALTSADGTATALLASGHGYRLDQVVSIAGAEQPAYNGQFRVLTTTATTFTYALADSATVTISPATTRSNLSARVAPLGWERPFAATHKAAYRSKNPQSPQNLLRVDDSLKSPDYDPTWAKWANVGIVEGLSDIDTPVGAQAPFDPNNPTQNWKQVTPGQWGWHKWYHARQAGYDIYGDGGAGPRNWVLIGDDRLFYLFCSNAPGTNWYGRNFYAFGDLISFKPGDHYGTVLCADDIYWSNSTALYASFPGQYNGFGLVSSLDPAGKVLLRNHTQIGHPVRFGATSLNTNNSQQICGRGSMPFPNGADFSLWLLPTYVRQEDGHMRGLLPGMQWMPQDRPYADLTVLDNVLTEVVTGMTPDLTTDAHRQFLLVRTQYSNEADGAMVAFDISGPWR